jgi:hypothetical protein
MSILRTYAITGSHSNGMHSGTRGGSTPGKAANRERCRVGGAARMDAYYFRRGDAAGRAPTFDERNFERRSALPHAMGSCTRFLRGEGGLLWPPKCQEPAFSLLSLEGRTPALTTMPTWATNRTTKSRASRRETRASRMTDAWGEDKKPSNNFSESFSPYGRA